MLLQKRDEAERNERSNNLIDKIITNIEDQSIIEKVKIEVESLCSSFPLYSELHN